MGEGSGIIKQLRNPAYGLMPMLVFAILIGWAHTSVAIGVSLALSLVGVLVVRKHSRMLYDISAITFAVALLLQLFNLPIDVFGKFVIVEITFVSALIISRLMRTKMLIKLAKIDNSNVRNYLAESFRIAFQTQYGLSFHLLLILLYYVFYSTNTSFISASSITISMPIILLIIILMEVFRLKVFDKKLNKEEWLPVVTESGDVTGKVAKSVTKEMKNKFMHPVVRVALINNGKIYLKKRDATRLLNPGMLDYPFEKYMEYNHDIDEAVRNAVRKEIGIENIPLRFLLKYTFENESTKRLIFLYVSIIDDDEKLNKLHLHDGKLWTKKQIEDNHDAHIFSECFELEFEYLKNTVLLKYPITEEE